MQNKLSKLFEHMQKKKKKKECLSHVTGRESKIGGRGRLGRD